MTWLKTNWKTAGIIVILLLCVAASAADSYRQRQLVKRLQSNLEDVQKAKVEELEEADEAWQKKVEIADRKLSPVLKERDALRAKLAALLDQESVPWAIPTSEDEIVARFQALGYKIRVMR